FGGDDGMRLKRRSQLGFVDLNDPVQFYYLALVLMLLAVYVTYRIVNSRFGIVLRATKSNEARSRAIGISPYLYRLTAFVIAGAMCGLAGVLYGNHTNYITPGLMSWQQSGDIMFMVILGGMASTIGQLAGDRRQDGGRILFAGEDIPHLPAPRRARKGLARSFQITSIYPEFTALHNVALAVQARAGHSFRFWRPALKDRSLVDPAGKILDEVGLGPRAGVLAANLAHGEQRQLEVAMALAT